MQKWNHVGLKDTFQCTIPTHYNLQFFFLSLVLCLCECVWVDVRVPNLQASAQLIPMGHTLIDEKDSYSSGGAGEKALGQVCSRSLGLHSYLLSWHLQDKEQLQEKVKLLHARVRLQARDHV